MLFHRDCWIALCRVRHRELCELYWIDSICIDQRKHDENTLQNAGIHATVSPTNLLSILMQGRTKYCIRLCLHSATMQGTQTTWKIPSSDAESTSQASPSSPTKSPLEANGWASPDLAAPNSPGVHYKPMTAEELRLFFAGSDISPIPRVPISL